jgi:DNA-directed RNA polymerase subunit H (RpoH/RPB5)
MNKVSTILYTEKEETYIVITNIVKMLMNRKWINNSEDIKNIVDKILKTENEMTYFYKDKVEYNFKFYLNKISSIKKTDLEEFIVKNKNNHKILITGDISGNTRQQIMDFGKIEVFSKDELMINIVDNILVPKHELLSDNDKKKFMEEYLAKPKELPRIFINDPIARYYYAKVGDIFRIERPSITSGFAISYRIVVSV